MGILEERVRYAIIRVIRAFLYICLALDICLFIYYVIMGQVEFTSLKYIFHRILLPFLLNLTIWIVASSVNKNKRYSVAIKQHICSLLLCTAGGIIGCFHSVFTALWCTPLLTILYASLFYDKKLLQKLTGYAYFLSVLAIVEAILEHPGNTGYYIQRGIAVLCLDILITVIAFTIVRYTNSVVSLLQKSSSQLETDSLTKLHSRPFIYEKAKDLIHNADTNRPVSMAIVDLDHFKRVNDTYGHDNGDVVLRSFGELITRHINDKFDAGRFGGEEFILLFDGMTAEEAYAYLDKMRLEFSEIHYSFCKESVTFSSGLVTITSPLTFKSMFTLVDQALYHSKENGRNQITVEHYRSR